MKSQSQLPLTFKYSPSNKLVFTVIVPPLICVVGLPCIVISTACFYGLAKFEWGGDDLPWVGVPFLALIGLATLVIGCGLIGFAALTAIRACRARLIVDEHGVMIRKTFRSTRIPTDDILEVRYETAKGGDDYDFSSRRIVIVCDKRQYRLAPEAFGMDFEDVKQFDAYLSKHRGVARHRPDAPPPVPRPATSGGEIAEWLQQGADRAVETDRYFGGTVELGLSQGTSSSPLQPGTCGWCGCFVGADQWLQPNGKEAACPSCSGILPPFHHGDPLPPPTSPRPFPNQLITFTRQKFRVGVRAGVVIVGVAVLLGLLLLAVETSNPTSAFFGAFVIGSFGVATIVFSILGIRDRVKTLRNGEVARGIVQRVSHRHRSEQYTIEIQFPFGGRTHKLYVQSGTASLGNYRVGQAVWVVFPPRRPYNGVLWPPIP